MLLPLHLCHLHIQGGFFNWTPPKFSKYRIPCKLAWNFSSVSSHKGILYLENLRGVQLKKPPCIYLRAACAYVDITSWAYFQWYLQILVNLNTTFVNNLDSVFNSDHS